MAEKMTNDRGLEDWELGLINKIKEMERALLNIIDAQFSTGGCNDRWLAIARTDFQMGFMSFIRAVAKPDGDDPNYTRGTPKAAPIKWDEKKKPLLGAAIRAEGLEGEGEGNY